MKPSAINKNPSEPTHGLLDALKKLLTRKIWLPKILYEGLPWFYALAGLSAVASTLFVSSWYWVLPYCWLLGLMCLHAAVYVWRIRRHYRRARREKDLQQMKTNSQDAGLGSEDPGKSKLAE